MIAATIDAPLSANPIESAKEHLKRGEHDLAERAFRAALATDPGDGAARVGLAQVLVLLGKKAEAVAECETVAGLYARQGREERAVEVYRRVIKIDAARAESHEKLGELLNRINRRDEGLAALETAAKEYGKQDRPADQLRVMQSLVAVAPEEERGRLRADVAGALLAAGRKDEALAEYREAADDLEGDGGPLAVINGRAKPREAKAYKLLLEVLPKIIAMVPDDLETILRLGRYQMAGRPSLAIATLHMALKIDRQNVAAIKLIDHAFLALGQFERAVVAFDEIRRIDPAAYETDPGYREEVGRLAAVFAEVDVLLGGSPERPDQAVQVARHLVTKFPGSIPARLKLKDVLFRLNQLDAAVSEIAFAVGLALEAGDAALAREVLQDGMRRAPSHPKVRELAVRVAESLRLI